MTTSNRITAQNTLMRWLYITNSNELLDFIQVRLIPNHAKNSDIYSNFYKDFNDKYVIPLQMLGYKVKLFSSNESLMGTIRRIYHQLETSKSKINKQYAKDLRNAYFNPLEVKPANNTDWFKLLMQNFNAKFSSEKIIQINHSISNYAEIGYYIKEADIPLEELLNDCDTYYIKWCNCVKQLKEYYNCKVYLDSSFSKSNKNPIDISILLCFETSKYPEYYFKVNFHTFGDLTEFHKEIFKLRNWSNKNKHTNNTPDEISDKKPETPDLEEMILIWSRPTINLSSSNKFYERTNEIGLRFSNYIKYN